jgi:hypothetical protein
LGAPDSGPGRRATECRQEKTFANQAGQLAPSNFAWQHERVHEINLITTIAFGLTAALIFGLLAKRFGLSPMQLNLHPAYRPLRLRGIYLRVQEEGRVRVGDRASVVERGSVQ